MTQVIETAIINKAHGAMATAGYKLFAVHDGEETERCTDISAAIKTVLDVDDVVTLKYDNGKPKGEGRVCVAIQFISGNGEDVLHDYSASLVDVLAGV